MNPTSACRHEVVETTERSKQETKDEIESQVDIRYRGDGAKTLTSYIQAPDGFRCPVAKSLMARDICVTGCLSGCPSRSLFGRAGGRDHVGGAGAERRRTAQMLHEHKTISRGPLVGSCLVRAEHP